MEEAVEETSVEDTDKIAKVSVADVAIKIFFEKKRAKSVLDKREKIEKLFKLVFNDHLTDTDACNKADLSYSTGKTNYI